MINLGVRLIGPAGILSCLDKCPVKLTRYWHSNTNDRIPGLGV
jgi:hypothetical protein